MTAQKRFGMKPDYTSAWINLSTGLGGSVAHGLGVNPQHVEIELKCVNADLNYSANDILRGGFTGKAAAGYAIKTDATNLDYRLENSTIFKINDWSDGSPKDPDVATPDWQIRFLAWR